MAYIVGKDDKDKKNPMGLLDSPGAFRNIKQQLQQDQLSQAIQPVHQAPMQPEKKEDQMKRFFNGGLVHGQQHFEEGDIVEIEGEGAGTGYKPKVIDQKSGQFVNIQDYLAANKARSEAMGEQVASYYEQEASDIGEDIAETESEYLGEEGTYGEGAEDFIDETIAGAGDQDLSDEEQDQWEELRDQTQGPDLQEQTAAAGQLESGAQSLGSSEGRYSAIQKALGPRVQTRGGSRLNQAIIGADRETSTDMVKRAREASQGLKSKYTNLGEGIQQAEQDRRKQIQTGVASEQNQMRTSREQLDARIKKALESDGPIELSKADMKLLGLKGMEDLYGVKLRDYLREGSISPQYFAKMTELAHLAGVEPSIDGHNISDPAGFMAKVAEAKGEYEPGIETRTETRDVAQTHYNNLNNITMPDDKDSASAGSYANQFGAGTKRYDYIVGPAGECSTVHTTYHYELDGQVFSTSGELKNYVLGKVQGTINTANNAIATWNEQYNIGQQSLKYSDPTPPPVEEPLPPEESYANGGIMNSFLKRYKR